jgi:citrate lyase subunit beta/citryl-CoA lyase
MPSHELREASDAVRRSWLLVPPSDEKQVEASWSYGADVVVLDLVELVHDGDKPQARERVRDAIGLASRGGAQVFAQVDRELLYADLRACVWRGLQGVIVSRLESAQEVEEADRLISQLEEERGLIPHTLQMVASLETALGNHNAAEIGRASPRLWGLTLGRADLVMDLRPEPSGEFHLMPYLMQRLIIAANAAGLVPLGAWWRAPARGLLAGPGDTYEAALRGRHIGFKGSMCIAPGQVGPLNRGFTPGRLEVAEAEQVVASLDGADSPVLSIDGRLLGPSTVKGARRLLSYAQACVAREDEKAQAVRQAREDVDVQEES